MFKANTVDSRSSWNKDDGRGAGNNSRMCIVQKSADAERVSDPLPHPRLDPQTCSCAHTTHGQQTDSFIIIRFVNI